MVVRNICSFSPIPGGYGLGRLQSSYFMYGGVTRLIRGILKVDISHLNQPTRFRKGV
jgi:hypothetical protein